MEVDCLKSLLEVGTSTHFIPNVCGHRRQVERLSHHVNQVGNAVCRTGPENRNNTS